MCTRVKKNIKNIGISYNLKNIRSVQSAGVRVTKIFHRRANILLLDFTIVYTVTMRPTIPKCFQMLTISMRAPRKPRENQTGTNVERRKLAAIENSLRSIRVIPLRGLKKIYDFLIVNRRNGIESFYTHITVFEPYWQTITFYLQSNAFLSLNVYFTNETRSI